MPSHEGVDVLAAEKQRLAFEAAAAGGRVGKGDVAGHGLWARAGVSLKGADGGVPGPGERHRGAGAVLRLVGMFTMVVSSTYTPGN